MSRSESWYRTQLQIERDVTRRQWRRIQALEAHIRKIDDLAGNLRAVASKWVTL